MSYFLEELCLYVGNQTGFDGEDTTQSHDLCHHNPALGIDSLSSPTLKNLHMHANI